MCSSEEAGLLALDYKARGFQTIKTKVGGRDLKDDINMLRAIRHNHPTCSLILDANGGYNASDALEVLRQLQGMFALSILIQIRLLDQVLSEFNKRDALIVGSFDLRARVESNFI